MKHFRWGFRLNYDVTMSDTLVPTPKFLKLTLDLGGYQANGGAIYPFTAYQGAETLYINIILIYEAL